MASEKSPVIVNGTAYRWPSRPLVAVCIDGGDPAYLRQFLRDGAMPHTAHFIAQAHVIGFRRRVGRWRVAGGALFAREDAPPALERFRINPHKRQKSLVHWAGIMIFAVFAVDGGAAFVEAAW